MPENKMTARAAKKKNSQKHLRVLLNELTATI